jgi:hypothetical protein
VAHCTNPDCRHRQRTGKPAEYQPSATHCADCGEPLQPGEPPPPTRPPGRPWPAGLLKRLGLTLAAMVAVSALAWLPNPMVDGEAAQAAFGTAIKAGPFSLGVRPLLVAFVLVELGALILPFTRERRRQDPRLRRRLWWIAAIAAVGFAAFQGLSLAFTLENAAHGGGMTSLYGGWGPDLVPRPGWMFRLATAGMCAIGTVLIAALVRGLDHRGFGPGMAALLLADSLALLPQDLIHQGRRVVIGEINLLHVLLTLLLIGALVVGASRILGQRSAGVGGLPAVLPPCGLMPYEWAITLLILPSTIAAFGAPGAGRLMDLLLPGGWLWIAVAIPVVLLGTPLASTLFYWRRRLWWTDERRGVWLWTVVTGAFLMLVLVLVDAILLRSMPMGAGALAWIVIVALLGDAWDELRAWRAQGAEPRELARHQDVADALEELDGLRAAHPDARFVLAGLRYRSLTYFFGPWVPLRILRVDGDHELKAKP